MKKLSYLLLAVVVFFMGTNAYAMTEAQLKSKLTQAYVVGGKTISATPSTVAELERYLNTHDLSAADCDYIASKFDEALAIAQAAGAIRWSDLNSTDKNKIVALVSNISSNTSVKATLTAGGNLTIYEADGSVFSVLSDIDVVIQNTNNNYFIIVIASVISLLGVVVIAKKVAGANA